MPLITVDNEYKIKIPDDIRKKIKISKGDIIKLESQNKKSLILKRDPLEISFGCWNYNKSGVKFVDNTRKGWERKIV